MMRMTLPCGMLESALTGGVSLCPSLEATDGLAAIDGGGFSVE